MTAQEKLHAVETAIRKALPRLLEPTEGCFMNLHYIDKKNKETVETCKIIGINKKGKLLVRYDDDEGYNILSKKGLDKYIKIGSYSILGHDILLSDVFEWLGVNVYKFGFENIRFTNIINDRYKIEIEREFLRARKYKVKEWTGTLLPYVDFSKPRLADQSEELWNFLYNLIEKN